MKRLILITAILGLLVGTAQAGKLYAFAKMAGSGPDTGALVQGKDFTGFCNHAVYKGYGAYTFSGSDKQLEILAQLPTIYPITTNADGEMIKVIDSKVLDRLNVLLAEQKLTAVSPLTRNENVIKALFTAMQPAFRGINEESVRDPDEKVTP